MSLTTLDSYKTYANITESDSNDQLLQFLIDAVSQKIIRYTGRNFAAANYVERHTLYGDNDIMVNQWPIISITKIAYGASPAINFTATDTNAIHNAINVTDTSLTTTYINAAGIDLSETYTLADYPSLSGLVPAINSGSGWTGTVVNNTKSTWLNPILSQDNSVTVYYPSSHVTNYSFDAKHGIVALNSGGSSSDGWPLEWWEYAAQGNFVNFMIAYRGGYETIPDDIELVTNQLVQQAQGLAETDPSQVSGNLKSESIGDYSYTLSDQAFQNLSAEQTGILNLYSIGKIGRRP